MAMLASLIMFPCKRRQYRNDVHHNANTWCLTGDATIRKLARPLLVGIKDIRRCIRAPISCWKAEPSQDDATTSYDSGIRILATRRPVVEM